MERDKPITNEDKAVERMECEHRWDSLTIDSDDFASVEGKILESNTCSKCGATR